MRATKRYDLYLILYIAIYIEREYQATHVLEREGRMCGLKDSGIDYEGEQ